MIERKVARYILCKIDGREYQIGDTYKSKNQARIDELTELGYLEDGEDPNSQELNNNQEPPAVDTEPTNGEPELPAEEPEQEVGDDPEPTEEMKDTARSKRR